MDAGFWNLDRKITHNFFQKLQCCTNLLIPQVSRKFFWNQLVCMSILFGIPLWCLRALHHWKTCLNFDGLSGLEKNWAAFPHEWFQDPSLISYDAFTSLNFYLLSKEEWRYFCQTGGMQMLHVSDQSWKCWNGKSCQFFFPDRLS